MFSLRNAFIMPPIKLGYAAGDGMVTAKHLRFYDIRAQYMGAITPEPLYPSAGLRELPTQLGIDADDKIEGLKTLTARIHAHGSKAIAHINHPGRMANPKIPGNFFWSSVDKACENGGAVPVAMDRKMMDEVVNLLTTAAQRAVSAGFDMVEIQFGHGYLMAQFLSPAVNNRTDRYGGSRENRFRFPLEVAQAIREAIDIPIIARLSGDEMIENGFHLDDMIAFSKAIQQTGFDALHITAGSACTTPPWFFQHMFIPKGKTWEMAEKIRNEVQIPVIFVGRITTFEDIDKLRQKGAEYLAVGRSMVADPLFIGRYLGYEQGNYRPCLSCAEGCLGGVKQGKGLGCMVNPKVQSGEAPLKKDGAGRSIAVIGGGISGMQAAITLKERGFEVDLYEKERLGGQFNLAALPPGKAGLGSLVSYFIHEINRLGINVLHHEANRESLEKRSYEALIMATGAHPTIPPIEGLTIFSRTEFLEQEQAPRNQHILIVGGGMIGLEMASTLIDASNRITMVEMTNTIAGDMEALERTLTLKKLNQKGAELLTNCLVKKIENSTAVLSCGEDHRTIQDVDHVVITTGMKSYLPFNSDMNIPTFTIGDANRVGNAQKAIGEAWSLAENLTL